VTGDNKRCLQSLIKCNSSSNDKRGELISAQVRETVKMLADMQKRLVYSLSLHDTICMNYRRMTEQELTLEEKVC